MTTDSPFPHIFGSPRYALSYLNTIILVLVDVDHFALDRLILPTPSWTQLAATTIELPQWPFKT